MSKAISEIRFWKSRVESLEKSISSRITVTISEIYFWNCYIFPKFPIPSPQSLEGHIVHVSKNIQCTVCKHDSKDRKNCDFVEEIYIYIYNVDHDHSLFEESYVAASFQLLISIAIIYQWHWKYFPQLWIALRIFIFMYFNVNAWRERSLANCPW